MPLTPDAYALLGLTAIIGALVAALTFALFRFLAAARDTRRNMKGGGAGEVALLSAALQEAVGKLKAQERATAARADASERLAGEIIDSLSSGLLVVDLSGEVRIINPAGRRMSAGDAVPLRDCRRLLREPLSKVIDECLSTKVAIARRTVRLLDSDGEVHMGVTVSPLFDGAESPRRHLPVHRSDGRQGAGGTASAEGKPRDGRRADGRDRARIPKRTRHDSRLRQAARPDRAAGRLPALRRRAFGTKTECSARSSRTSSISPSPRRSIPSPWICG